MKICFITGSRADYGLLTPLMRLVKSDKYFNFQLIATGTHFSKRHGSTFKQIIKDKFKINFKINIKIGNDQPENICKSMSIAIDKFSKAFKVLKPDLLILLGDRYEIFAASAAALVHQIPISHLHGGELTRGSIDDSFRHSITKMSNIHLVSNKKHAKRVIQLGENPKNVHVVGGFGVDLIGKTKFLKKGILRKELGIKFKKKNIIVTYHPETVIKSSPVKDFNEVLKAINKFKDINFIFTKSNSDLQAIKINKMIDLHVKKNKKNCYSFESMGQSNFLSTLKIADCILGNSSSGILEAPSLKKPTINIGSRQKDRLQSKSIINVKPSSESIIKAIKKIYSKDFKNKIQKTESPYGKAGASKKAFKILKNKNLEEKKFFDIL